MKKQYIDIIYNQWEDMNLEQNTGIENSIITHRKELRGRMDALKGRWMDQNSLLDLEEITNALQSEAHYQGFYTGFELACSILREMIGVNKA